MMIKSATQINWRYAGDAVPAFVTMVLMPFTYSIADGLIGGVCTYIVINSLVWVIEKLSFGRIVPPNKHEKEPWTWRVEGGILPSWLKRLVARARGESGDKQSLPGAGSPTTVTSDTSPVVERDELIDGKFDPGRSSQRSSAVGAIPGTADHWGL